MHYLIHIVPIYIFEMLYELQLPNSQDLLNRRRYYINVLSVEWFAGQFTQGLSVSNLHYGSENQEI